MRNLTNLILCFGDCFWKAGAKTADLGLRLPEGPLENRLGHTPRLARCFAPTLPLRSCLLHRRLRFGPEKAAPTG